MVERTPKALVALTSTTVSVSDPIINDGTISVSLADVAVVPGSYLSANITVDSKGRVTAASNGTYRFVTETTGGFRYYGKATTGSSTAAAVWKVWRRDLVTQAITKADGNDLYDNVGVNMHTLTFA